MLQLIGWELAQGKAFVVYVVVPRGVDLVEFLGQPLPVGDGGSAKVQLVGELALLFGRFVDIGGSGIVIPSPVARLLRLWIGGLVPRDWTSDGLLMDGTPAVGAG